MLLKTHELSKLSLATMKYKDQLEAVHKKPLLFWCWKMVGLPDGKPIYLLGQAYKGDGFCPGAKSWSNPGLAITDSGSAKCNGCMATGERQHPCWWRVTGLLGVGRAQSYTEVSSMVFSVGARWGKPSRIQGGEKVFLYFGKWSFPPDLRTLICLFIWHNVSHTSPSPEVRPYKRMCKQ